MSHRSEGHLMTMFKTMLEVSLTKFLPSDMPILFVGTFTGSVSEKQGGSNQSANDPTHYMCAQGKHVTNVKYIFNLFNELSNIRF